MNTFWSFDNGGGSPHHAYHGAIAAGRVLEMGITLSLFSEEAQKKAVHDFLQLLQEKSRDFSGSRYARFPAEKV
ncbi:MAG: hypothetical protein OEW48_14185 [Phycisphaerae bacterium]|nr:hypothetical protein [Phycisphaerae bacterium]